MVQCAGGSTKQAGAPTFFQFDSATVGSFLPFGAAIAWLGLLSLPAGPVDTGQFCLKEPPATTMSAADWIALGIPPLAKITGAYSRLSDWIQQNAFAQYCVCTGSSTSSYATQILALGPSWYLKMGDNPGPNLVDSGPSGHTGLASGSFTPNQTALMTGDPSKALGLISGANARGYSGLPAIRWNGTSSLSMEFWGKFSTPGAAVAVYDSYNASNPYIQLQLATTGKMSLAVRDSAGVSPASAGYTAGTVNDGLAHQIDLVFDGTAHTIKLYIDAALALTETGLSANSYMDSAGGHFLGFDSSSGLPSPVMTVGHWSLFPFALSSVQISDNKAAAGGTTIYQPQPYTPPADGTPPAGTAPVCASYQDVCNQLYVTDQLLQGLAVQLSMFSSRTTPSLFRAETTHAGLTGSGVIMVQDIVGLHVSLTTVPSTWGSTAETPRRLIPSAGSLQAGSLSQYTDNWQLHYEEEIVMISSTWASQIRYNFRPGIVATIVELVPAG